MTDPTEALTSLQIEIRRGLRFMRCELDSSIGVFVDKPNGRTRFSYANIENLIVKALSLFVAIEPIDGVACFAVGYAVPREYRNKGLATELVKKSITELQNGLGKNGVDKFYIEAVIGTDNIASKQVATNAISTTHEQITDSVSGKEAFRYLRLVKCK